MKNNILHWAIICVAGIAGAGIIFAFREAPAVAPGSAVAIVKGADSGKLEPRQSSAPSSGAIVYNQVQEGDPEKEKALRSVDENISPVIKESPDLKSMHEKLLSQGRDNTWARQSEMVIDKVYSDLSKGRESGNKVSVNCGTTLCEVSGFIKNAEDQNDEFRAGLSKPELAADMWKKGYRNMGEGYAVGRGGGESFVTYYQREAPVEVKVGRLPPKEENN